jgi:ABC-type uncharacterized transport system permease subunit
MGQLIYCWVIAGLLLVNYGEVEPQWLQIANLIGFAYFVIIGAVAGWLWARTR